MLFGSTLVNVAVVLAIAATIVAASGFGLWLALGRPRLSPSQQGVLSPSDVYDGIKIALTVVGGIGGVVALVVAYRRQRFAEREHAREDVRLFTDRFRAASEQLGSDKSAIRLAGVYAMASLADDWPAERQTCVNVLCAYLRMPYEPPPSTPPPSPSSVPPPAPAGHAEDASVNVAEVRRRREEQQVRHTVIQVIGAHLRNDASASWQGCDLDFSGAVFDGGDLRGAVFSGGAVNFGGATFSSGRMDFSRATFSGGRVDFSGATFSGCEVDFSGASFSGSRMDFSGASFSSGTVDFGGASFSSGTVNFGNAKFSGGRVDFSRATFSGSTVNFGFAKFSGSRMGFGGASFSGSRMDFGCASFSGSRMDFSRATFSGGTVDLRAVTFTPECKAQSVHSLLEIPEDQPLPAWILADTGPVPVQRG